MNVATVDDDEKPDGFPLAPTSATETDDAAGSAEVNVATRGGDEETGGLLLAPTFATEIVDATVSVEVNAAIIKPLDSSSSLVC